MHRSTTTRFRALAAAGLLTVALAVTPGTAQASGIGGSNLKGQASAQGGAQTAGLLDWLFCYKVGKSAPC